MQTMTAIAVEWRDGRREGRVEITNGRLAALAIAKGEGSAQGDRFALTSDGPCRLEITLDEVNI